jgi:hypothetical protein
LESRPKTIYGMLSKGNIKMVNAVKNSAFFVNGRLMKVALVICFSLLAISILASHEAPATGYEASIY